jgi:hypothetical protein
MPNSRGSEFLHRLPATIVFPKSVGELWQEKANRKRRVVSNICLNQLF